MSDAFSVVMMIRPSRSTLGLSSELVRNVSCSGLLPSGAIRHRSEAGKNSLRLRTGPVTPPAWAPPRVDANTIALPSGPQAGSKLWTLMPLTSGWAGVTR